MSDELANVEETNWFKKIVDEIEENPDEEYDYTQGVLIKPTGVYLLDWVEGGVDSVKITHPFKQLSNSIRVEEGVTFEHIFNHVMNNIELCNTIFASHLGYFDL